MNPFRAGITGGNKKSGNRETDWRVQHRPNLGRTVRYLADCAMLGVAGKIVGVVV
jgi:hypothetical protein